jgi:hypothetical protein
MQSLRSVLRRELERPRRVSEQVIKHLAGVHEVQREDVGEFLERELGGLPEVEQELVLAPLFTPSLADQAVVAAELEHRSCPRSEWPGLMRELQDPPVQAQLLTAADRPHAVRLPEVIVERYVHRLRLDGEITPEVLALLPVAPAEERPLWLAMARRAVWQSRDRREILVRFLAADSGPPCPGVADGVALLKCVETYEPVNLAALQSGIPHWQGVLRETIASGGSPRLFFNERVEEMHGGGREQRRPDDARQLARVQEWEFLQRLARRFGGPQ